MFVSKPGKVSLTLFCYLALFLAVAAVAQAEPANHNAGRDHVVLHRMLKKRADAGTNGAAGDPPVFPSSSSASVAASSTASASSASETSSAATSSSASSASASQTSASSASSSAASSSSSSSASSSSASSSSSSSSASSTQSSSSVVPTSSSTPTSTAAQPTNTDTTPTPNDTSNNNSAADDNTASQTSKSVNFMTQTVTSDASATASSGASTVSGATSSSIPKAALTVIIVIASCVGAIAIGFTIIRKWKFKPSSDFDNRMTPIDWQPAGSDDGIPGLQRNASTASHGSFHSSGHSDENFAGRGVGNNYGSSGLQPIPDHDFTAGAANLAPVGGYADLARGPSPGPQMSQLQRGPSVGHGFANQADPYAYNPRY